MPTDKEDKEKKKKTKRKTGTFEEVCMCYTRYKHFIFGNRLKN